MKLVLEKIVFLLQFSKNFFSLRSNVSVTYLYFKLVVHMILQYGEELKKIITELIMMILRAGRNYRIVSKEVVPAAAE